MTVGRAVALPDDAAVPAGKLTLEGKRSDGVSMGVLSIDRIDAYSVA